MIYDIADKYWVENLRKKSGMQPDEQRKVFDLFKKYVDPSILNFIPATSCGSCEKPILKQWARLVEFMMINENLFKENE